MELHLTEPERKLLQELLQGDLTGLLLEIARTDNRAMREILKKREGMVSSILARLEVELLQAS